MVAVVDLHPPVLNEALQTVSDAQRATFKRALDARLREELARRRVAYLRVDYEPLGAIRAALDEAGIPWDNLGRPFGFRKSVTRVTADGREPPEDPEGDGAAAPVLEQGITVKLRG